ncbi:MAG: YdcF family protein, partial [Solobacterium sp.]|nr:YdcF family protein [Solobacterium sp.]
PADLLLRLQTALSCAEEYPDADLIVCGGNHDASGCTEAGFMMNWLKGKGISSGRMILEDKSADTISNFRNAAKLIDPQGPVILVTSSYHIYRAVKMAARAGFTTVGRRPAASAWLSYPANVMWETVLILAGFLPGQR